MSNLIQIKPSLPTLSCNTVKSTKCQVIDLEMVEYQKAYRIQKEILEERKRGKVFDTLLLLEHPSVITIGRASSGKNILVSKEELKRLSIMIYRTDRGGDVTFHGPGQLVAYSIFDLKEQTKDVHLYLRKLEEVVIQFLKEYELRGLRQYGLTGVWVDGQKIASIVIGVSNWVTYHGLATNVNTDLDKFLLIKPCGIDNCKITSLTQLLRKTVSIPEAKGRLVKAFEKVFNLEIKCVKSISLVA
jgi:lipoate-protein ligase B